MAFRENYLGNREITLQKALRNLRFHGLPRCCSIISHFQSTKQLSVCLSVTAIGSAHWVTELNYHFLRMIGINKCLIMTLRGMPAGVYLFERFLAKNNKLLTTHHIVNIAFPFPCVPPVIRLMSTLWGRFPLICPERVTGLHNQPETVGSFLLISLLNYCGGGGK